MLKKKVCGFHEQCTDLSLDANARHVCYPKAHLVSNKKQFGADYISCIFPLVYIFNVTEDQRDKPTCNFY